MILMELKATAYDILSQIENLQRKLSQLNQEIAQETTKMLERREIKKEEPNV